MRCIWSWSTGYLGNSISLEVTFLLFPLADFLLDLTGTSTTELLADLVEEVRFLKRPIIVWLICVLVILFSEHGASGLYITNALVVLRANGEPRSGYCDWQIFFSRHWARNRSWLGQKGLRVRLRKICQRCSGPFLGDPLWPIKFRSTRAEYYKL